MKAKVWITFRVEVEVEADSDQGLREAAVKKIPDLEPDDWYAATKETMQIGEAYPHDVTEIVEMIEDDIEDDSRQHIYDAAREQHRRRGGRR